MTKSKLSKKSSENIITFSEMMTSTLQMRDDMYRDATNMMIDGLQYSTIHSAMIEYTGTSDISVTDVLSDGDMICICISVRSDLSNEAVTNIPLWTVTGFIVFHGGIIEEDLRVNLYIPTHMIEASERELVSLWTDMLYRETEELMSDVIDVTLEQELEDFKDTLLESGESVKVSEDLEGDDDMISLGGVREYTRPEVEGSLHGLKMDGLTEAQKQSLLIHQHTISKKLQ